jgi:hypothetical protein
LARPRTWLYSDYNRSFGFTTHAGQYGVLADPLYNRDIRPQRVEEYAGEMRAGNWKDLLSDPITVTGDGQVLNGQHRLAAASDVDWENVGNDPRFLIVWGVQPQEALYADGSRRTPKDSQTVAGRLIGSPQKHDEDAGSGVAI